LSEAWASSPGNIRSITSGESLKNSPDDGGGANRRQGVHLPGRDSALRGGSAVPTRRPSALTRHFRCEQGMHSQAAILAELRRVILEAGVPPGTPIPVDQVAEATGALLTVAGRYLDHLDSSIAALPAGPGLDTEPALAGSRRDGPDRHGAGDGRA
jgi:hypothetical protein